MKKPSKTYKTWRYKNTFFLIISIAIVGYGAVTPFGQEVLRTLSSFGYAGSFITGIFFVSTFTVAPASILLVTLAQHHHPLAVALTAGIGAVVGDYLIFRFLKDRVFEEITPLLMKLGGSRIKLLISTPYFAWLAPVLGAIIIASPFPDEIGVGLMGISKLNNWQFIAITFLLNSIGILLIVTLARLG